jgi:signal transduction histidine kinase
MQERAELLGGRFELSSNPGRGTCVEVIIPYQLQSEPETQKPDLS